MPEALAARAAELGQRAIALTDRDSVSGVPSLCRAARRLGIRAIAGSQVTLGDGARLTLLATGPEGYAGLCRLLTTAHLGSRRGEPRLPYQALAGEQGLIALTGGRGGPVDRALLARRADLAEEALRRLRELLPGRLYVEIQRSALPGDQALEAGLCELARRLNLPQVASAAVHHLRREDFWVHDLLTCVRIGCSVDEVRPERPLNGERYLLSEEEVAARFSDRPELVTATDEIAARCLEPITPGVRLYPAYPLPPGHTAQGTLEQLVREGAGRRYGGLRGEVGRRLRHELGTIAELGFAEYFLLVWDVVRFARAEDIRVAGRGSAADSAVAYCLGLTEVDPIARRLLFERFLSRERAERPDIDLDFDHRARDRVAAYLFRRYGEEHVAGVATYQTFQGRSAVRDLGKALGFPAAEVEEMQRRLPHMPADAILRRWDLFPELRAVTGASERLALLLRAAAAVAGLPRHLGTHLGGLIVSRQPVSEVAPRQLSAKGVAIVPFDKVDVEDIGFLKLDLLSLRTLAVLDEAYRAAPELAESRAAEDPAAMALVASGETIGLFQLESPAQRALQGQMGARSFEDIVHALAIIRPGPIKGNMVTPYLRRRAGRESVTYLDPRLRPILEKTYGVVLFQEQVIEIATTIGGFTPGESDQLRRVMTHARSAAEMESLGELFCAKAARSGTDPTVAREIFTMLQGYASYGFPEAHAAAFAHTALRTAQLSARRPEALFAGLLSQQPMGYYPPHILIGEALRRGVRFRPLDIRRSLSSYTVEEDGAVRVGLCAVRGLGAVQREVILATRRERPFTSLQDLAGRTGLKADELAALCDAGALDGFDRNRRRLLWQIGAQREEDGLFPPVPRDMPDFAPWQRFWRQEAVLGLRGPSRLAAAARTALRRQGIASVGAVKHLRHGETVRVAGVPYRPHRPPTRSGTVVAFFMLEDETGLLDLVAVEDVYRRQGDLLFGRRPPLLGVEGRVQRRGRGITLRAEELFEPDLGLRVE